MVQARILSGILAVIEKKGISESVLAEKSGIEEEVLNDIFHNDILLTMEHIALLQHGLDIVLQPPNILSIEEHKKKFYMKLQLQLHDTVTLTDDAYIAFCIVEQLDLLRLKAVQVFIRTDNKDHSKMRNSAINSIAELQTVCTDAHTEAKLLDGRLGVTVKVHSNEEFNKLLAEAAEQHVGVFEM